MKKLFVFLACVISIHATAQLGTLIGAATSLVPHNATIFKKVKSEVDTFHCNYGSIPYIRYLQPSLDRYISGGGDVVMVHIKDLQQTFDKCQSDIAKGATYLNLSYANDNLAEASKKMDVTLYQNEYNFYNNYTTDKGKAEHNQIVAAREENARILDSLERLQRAKDELTKDIITPEDSAYAANFDITCGPCYSTRAGRAYRKVQAIHEVAARHKADSLRQIQSEQQQREEEAQLKIANEERMRDLTKQFGAAVAKKLMVNQVWVGMTEKMLYAELGDPSLKKTTYTSGGTTEVLLFQGIGLCLGDCPYMNLVVSIQNHTAIKITTIE